MTDLSNDVDDADDVPLYDNEDLEGDRQPFLDDPEWQNIQDLFPDEPVDP